jgi:glutamyl-tRNA synthetase
MRLGWSPGHDDILTKEAAVAQFDLPQIGKAPARLDFKKLDFINAHFIALADDARLTRLLIQYLEANSKQPLAEVERNKLARAVPVVKGRSKTLLELAEQARFLLLQRPLVVAEAAAGLFTPEFRDRLKRLCNRLAAEPVWNHTALANALKAFATTEGIGLGQIGPGLRAVLTGGAPAPDLGQTLELLGREEALARISDRI